MKGSEVIAGVITPVSDIISVAEVDDDAEAVALADRDAEAVLVALADRDAEAVLVALADRDADRDDDTVDGRLEGKDREELESKDCEEGGLKSASGVPELVVICPSTDGRSNSAVHSMVDVG